MENQNTKHQASEKFQTSSFKRRPGGFGWSLIILSSLELGIWSFLPGQKISISQLAVNPKPPDCHTHSRPALGILA
jgi:hypothetical protein